MPFERLRDPTDFNQWMDAIIKRQGDVYTGIPDPRGQDRSFRNVPMIPLEQERSLQGPKYARPDEFMQFNDRKAKRNPAQPISAEGGEDVPVEGAGQELTPDAQEAFGETPDGQRVEDLPLAPWLQGQEQGGAKRGASAIATEATRPALGRPAGEPVRDIIPDVVKEGEPEQPAVTSQRPAQTGELPTEELPLAPWLQQGQDGEVDPDRPLLSPEDVTPEDIKRIPKSLAQKARDAGLGLEGVSASVRLQASLALGAPREDLGRQKEIFRRALEQESGKRAEVDFNAQTGELVYRLEDSDGKWNLVKGAGLSSILQDLAAAVPELAITGLEVGVGVFGGGVGGALMAPTGPTGIAAGGLVGNALGAGAASLLGEWARLTMAKAQGLDISDDEIWEAGYNRLKWTVGATVATATLLKLAGTAWRLWKGEPVELLEAFKNKESLARGEGLAVDLENRAAAATSRDWRSLTTGTDTEFPVTAGQQAGLDTTIGPRAGAGKVTPLPREADTALLAEEALSRRDVGEALSGTDRARMGVYTKQAEVQDAVDYAIFGGRDSTPQVTAGRILQASMNKAIAEKEAGAARKLAPYKKAVEDKQQTIENISSARTPEEIFTSGTQAKQRGFGMLPTLPVASVREELDTARRGLFAGFKTAYDKLEAQAQEVISLGPMRDAARELEKKFGTKYLDTISVVKAQKGVIKGAEQAGLRLEIINGVKRVMDNPVSLGELERMRHNINLQIRTAENAARVGGKGSGEALIVLRRLKEGLDASLERSLPPEAMVPINNLRQGYAQAIEKFDKGVLGQLVEQDTYGRFAISGQKAVDFLTGDVANTHAFLDALGASRFYVNGKLVSKQQPELGRVLAATQEGILSHMQRQFKDGLTGKWDTKAMGKWMDDRADALKLIFGRRFNAKTNNIDLVAPVDNLIGRTAGSLRRLQVRADAQEKALTAARNLFERRMGVLTADPAVLVRRLIDEGRVSDLKMAQRLINRMAGPWAKEQFRDGLGKAVRMEISDAAGKIDVKKLDDFLVSERGKQITATMGKEWGADLKTLSDIIKVREMTASGTAARDIAETIGRGVPGLRGMLRFARVIAPPMAARGRALTAAIGVMNEKSQRQMAELLSNPRQLRGLIKAAEGEANPSKKAFRVQMTRLGFEHVLDFWDLLGKANSVLHDELLDINTSVDEKQGKAEFDQMGKPVQTEQEPLQFNPAQEGGGKQGAEPAQKTEERAPPLSPDDQLLQDTQQLEGQVRGQRQGTEDLAGQGQGSRFSRPISRPGDIQSRPTRPFQATPGDEPGVDVPKNVQPFDPDYGKKHLSEVVRGLAGKYEYTGPGQRESENVIVDNPADRGQAGKAQEPLPFQGVAEAVITKGLQIKGMGEKARRNLAAGVDHIMKTMETAVYGEGEEQHRAAVELSTLVSGGGSTFAKGNALGSAGGRLKLIKGGELKVEEALDRVGDKLSEKLRTAARGDDPAKSMASVRKDIDELRGLSGDLLKTNEGLLPDLTKMTKRDLDRMGLTLEQYKGQLIQHINEQIDDGVRGGFKVISGGKAYEKPVNANTVAGWLRDAGATGITVERKGKSGTTYIKFDDPSVGMGRGEVRIPSDKHTASRPDSRRLDTGSEPPSNFKPTAGSRKASERQASNVEGGSYAEWDNLISALKWRLSRSPDGQFLISPGKEPKPRAKPLASEKAPTISRDPNQLEFDLPPQRFGPASPFDGMIR